MKNRVNYAISYIGRGTLNNAGFMKEITCPQMLLQDRANGQIYTSLRSKSAC